MAQATDAPLSGACPARLTLKVTMSPSFTCTPSVSESRSVASALATAAEKSRTVLALAGITTEALCSPETPLRAMTPPPAATLGVLPRVTVSVSSGSRH